MLLLKILGTIALVVIVLFVAFIFALSRLVDDDDHHFGGYC